MSRRAPSTAAAARASVTRCAIYTRKSSEEGLAQEFNSLDAQREAAEAYITSQRAEGWVALPDRYDDGGFTGGNMERPGLKALLADIAAGKVDCVIVYKVDRLSRSLMDFSRIMATFEASKVSFVSVTQAFNTRDSMGRLMLNVLLSFAQFEREIIGERIRDKVAAQRRKGKWAGGKPVLGYDVDRSNPSPKLIVNAAEAARVCEIYELYIELGSLLPVVEELDAREWRLKAWTSKAGKALGGRPFDRGNLHDHLTNPIYLGKIRHRDEVHPGEHEAIVPEELFRRVQAQLQANARGNKNDFRNRYGALLKRLLFCKACGRAMVHSFNGSKPRVHRYYVCCGAIKKGRGSCPSGSLPAAEIERAVVDEIRCLGSDRAMLDETLRAALGQIDAAVERLIAERRVVERGLVRTQAELRRVLAADPSTASAGVVSALHDHTATAEARLRAIAEEITAQEREMIEPREATAALAGFDDVWSALSPREQVDLLRLLVARVDYDARDSAIEVSFHADGIRALAARDVEVAA